MNKKYLYLIAAAIWGIPGIVITIKGLGAYLSMPLGGRWWLFLVTLAVLTGFFLMFRRIVDKYSARIAALPEYNSFFQTFPLRGWILIVCMMCLGIVLKFVPGIPAAFTASFYSGLGPMLVVAAVRFITNGMPGR